MTRPHHIGRTKCLFLLLATLVSFSSNAQQLEPISLDYTISLVSSRLGNATLGQLETTLTKEGDGYSVFSSTKAQGLAAIIMGSEKQQKCDFTINDGQVQSISYSGGSVKKTDYDVSFDWENRKLVFSDEESLDMPQGYIINFCNMPFAAALLRNEGELGQTIYVLTEKRVRGYILKSSNEVTLETPVGQFDTVKVVLERELDPEKTVSLWLSPSHNFTPIKIEDKRESRTITSLVNRIDS